MPISDEQLVELHPEVYHMAEPSSWASIQANGLLSTEALLDLFEITGEERTRILSEHRPEMVRIEHPTHGVAWVRDQKPMSDGGLQKALQDSLTPKDWYEILNRKTFFWATKERLSRFTNAAPYREKKHCVLTIDTQSLLDAHIDKITLSHYNSGCTKPNPFPRGKDCFLPLGEFPFNYWKQKSSARKAIAEVVAEYSVPDITNHIIRVDMIRGSEHLGRIA